MDLDVILTSLLIVAARIADVSLGTIRTMAVINGRRGVAWCLGFAEVLVWVLVVSRVITRIDESPLYPIAYALGFATGNFIGITIESRLAMGRQAVRVFTRQGPAIAEKLRSEGFGVTEFTGKGRDGPVDMLFIETRRKSSTEVLATSRAIDPTCYLIVHDVRLASAAAHTR